MLGTSFSPATQNADPAQLKRRRLPVQQALQTLSLRLPKFEGQGSVAPAELMSGRGLSGASDQSLAGTAAMVRALLGAGAGAQQGTGGAGAGWPGGMLPGGLPTPAPRMGGGPGGPMGSMGAPPPRNAPMPGVTMGTRGGGPPPVGGGAAPMPPRSPRFTSPTGQQVAPQPQPMANPNTPGGGYLDANHLPPQPTGGSFNYYTGQGLF